MADQPLTQHIQALVGNEGLVTKWVLIAEVARSDGGFSLWHASDGCTPWDAEGLLSYGCRAVTDDMEDND